MRQPNKGNLFIKEFHYKKHLKQRLANSLPYNLKSEYSLSIPMRTVKCIPKGTAQINLVFGRLEKAKMIHMWLRLQKPSKNRKTLDL
jgi:hypothetical protein